MVPNFVSRPLIMTLKAVNYNSYWFLYTVSNFPTQAWYTIISRTFSVENKHEVKRWQCFQFSAISSSHAKSASEN